MPLAGSPQDESVLPCASTKPLPGAIDGGAHCVLDVGLSDGRQEGSHSRKLGSEQSEDGLAFGSVDAVLSGQVQS